MEGKLERIENQIIELQCKIDKYNDPFLTYGWSKRLEELKTERARLLSAATDACTAPAIK